MRQASYNITINGKAVTADLTPYLLSLSFSEKYGDELDDFNITLEDRERLFQSSWAIKEGTKIKASITCQDWFSPLDAYTLDFGTFECDELELRAGYDGDIVTIKALPAVVSTSLKNEKKTRAWNNTTLKMLVNDISKENGLKAFFKDVDDEIIDRFDQRGEADLAFLSGLCKKYGYRLVLKQETLIVYSGQTADESEPIPLSRQTSHITSASFKRKLEDVYSGAVVTSTSVADSTTSIGVAKPNNSPLTGKTLRVNQRVTSKSQADRVADAKLREKNARHKTATVSMMGDPRMRAGRVVAISGFGAFDGKYCIKESRHSISNTGYTTEINIEEALDY